MDDDTRHSTLDEILSKLTVLHENYKVLIDKQHRSIESVTNSMADFKIGLQKSEIQVEQYTHRPPQRALEIQSSSLASPNSQPTCNHYSSDSSNQSTSMCWAAPRFSGENSSSWISSIQRYFDFYNTPDPQRLIIASFYLDGDALVWYEEMRKNQFLLCWKGFLLALENQFGVSDNVDSIGILSEVMQSGSSIEFRHMFDQLPNKIFDEKEPRNLTVSALPPLFPRLLSKIQSPREVGMVAKDRVVLKSCMDPTGFLGTNFHMKVLSQIEFGDKVKVLGLDDILSIGDDSAHSPKYDVVSIDYIKNANIENESSIVQKVTIEVDAKEWTQDEGISAILLAMNHVKTAEECTKGNLQGVTRLVKANPIFELHGIMSARRFRNTHVREQNSRLHRIQSIKMIISEGSSDRLTVDLIRRYSGRKLVKKKKRRRKKIGARVEPKKKKGFIC